MRTSLKYNSSPPVSAIVNLSGRFVKMGMNLTLTLYLDQEVLYPNNSSIQNLTFKIFLKGLLVDIHCWVYGCFQTCQACWCYQYQGVLQNHKSISGHDANDFIPYKDVIYLCTTVLVSVGDIWWSPLYFDHKLWMDCLNPVCHILCSFKWALQKYIFNLIIVLLSFILVQAI